MAVKTTSTTAIGYRRLGSPKDQVETRDMVLQKYADGNISIYDFLNLFTPVGLTDEEIKTDRKFVIDTFKDDSIVESLKKIKIKLVNKDDKEVKAEDVKAGEEIKAVLAYGKEEYDTDVKICVAAPEAEAATAAASEAEAATVAAPEASEAPEETNENDMETYALYENKLVPDKKTLNFLLSNNFEVEYFTLTDKSGNPITIEDARKFASFTTPNVIKGYYLKPREMDDTVVKRILEDAKPKKKGDDKKKKGDDN